MSEINIHVTATDDASGVMQQVASNTTGSMDQIKNSSQGVTNAVNQTNISTQQTALAFNNVATSGMALFMSYERVQNAQVMVDRANLMVQRSTESLEKAQTAYNDAVTKYGPDSQQAKDALDKLNISQEALRVAQERADMAQRNLNNTWLQAAMTVIPSIITMITSLSRALGGLSGMSGTLSNIGQSVGGLGSAGGGEGVGGEVLGGFGEVGGAGVGGVGGAGGAIGGGMVGLGGALTATAAIALTPLLADFAGKQAEAIAQNPNLQGLMTIRGGGAMSTGTNPFTSTVGQVLQQSDVSKAVDTLTKAINSNSTALDSLTSNVAPTQTIPGVAGHFQHGGIVMKPTIGLVGEAGPEAIIPLGNGYGFGLGDVNIILTVEGSVDRRTADYTIQRIREELRNVIIEATSSGASSTHKKIRRGSVF